MTIGKIPLKDGLYKVEHKALTKTANIAHKVWSIDELHCRMGHISPRAITNLVTKGIIVGVQLDLKSTPTFCISCATGKMTCKPIPKERTGLRTTKIGSKVHTDVWGPTTPESDDGHAYFITFTNDFTQWTWAETMRNKSDSFSCYKQYKAWLDMQHGAKIKQLQSDRGGEYLSEEFDQHMKSQGTVRSLTTHDTPEQNSVAECLNRTLIEHACAIHDTADLLKFLWPE